MGKIHLLMGTVECPEPIAMHIKNLENMNYYLFQESSIDLHKWRNVTKVTVVFHSQMELHEEDYVKVILRPLEIDHIQYESAFQTKELKIGS